MKARIKRIKARLSVPFPCSFDKKFVKVSICHLPILDERFIFYLSKPLGESWHTTDVQSLNWTKERIVFKTCNSTYELRPGWR